MNGICSKLCHYIVIFHALAALVIGAIALAVPHWFARGNGGSAGLFELCPNGLQCALGKSSNSSLQSCTLHCNIFKHYSIISSVA